MNPIKMVIGLGGVFFGIIGILLLAVASIIAIFKINEADHYYGVNRLGGERLALKGLPFSLWRMTEYGIVILFSKTSLAKKAYKRELMAIAENNPPQNLNRLIKWLYTSWFICVILSAISGALLGIFF